MFWIFVILGIVLFGGVLIYGAIQIKKKNKPRVLEIVAILIALLTYFFSLYTYSAQDRNKKDMNDNIKQIQQQIISVSNAAVINGGINSEDGITITETGSNSHIDQSINKTEITYVEEDYDYPAMSAEQLLSYAEKFYNAENYEMVVYIYGLQQLLENETALTNLGYMYANGIYFEQNFDKAKEYYERAIELGSEKALTNELAMCFDNALDCTPDVLMKGYEQKNIIAGKYVYSRFENADIEDEEKCIDALANLASLWVDTRENSEDAIPEVIKNAYYEWVYSEYVNLAYVPSNDFFTRYIPVTTTSYLNLEQGEAGLINTYKCYKLKCIDIYMLDESFDWI